LLFIEKQDGLTRVVLVLALRVPSAFAFAIRQTQSDSASNHRGRPGNDEQVAGLQGNQVSGCVANRNV
jgi:hypothetical protein